MVESWTEVCASNMEEAENMLSNGEGSYPDLGDNTSEEFYSIDWDSLEEVEDVKV